MNVNSMLVKLGLTCKAGSTARAARHWTLEEGWSLQSLNLRRWNPGSKWRWLLQWSASLLSGGGSSTAGLVIGLSLFVGGKLEFVLGELVRTIQRNSMRGLRSNVERIWWLVGGWRWGSAIAMVLALLDRCLSRSLHIVLMLLKVCGAEDWWLLLLLRWLLRRL